MPSETFLQQAVRIFGRAARNLLAGGLLLVSADWLQVALREPGALLSPHRYAAALLPAALLISAIVCGPWLLVRRRLDRRECATREVLPLLPAAGLGVLGMALSVLAVWLVWGRRLQLPLDASLVVGSAVCALLLGVVILALRRPPPPVLIGAGILWGLYIAAEPFHRTMPEHALLPVLALWPMAACLSLPRPRLLAGTAALVSVLGLYGYADDRGAVSQLVRRSVVASPLAQTLRSVIDFDADGYSAILGGGDCDDFDAAISPRELEVVGNGKDDNCQGGDLAEFRVAGRGASAAAIPRAPLPDVVLLSLDAVRPDFMNEELMPNVAALAKKGIHAPVAYTPAPYTGHALVGLMTSTVGIDHVQGGRFFGYEPQLGLVLGAAGYRSVAVHCLADLAADLVQGFDFVDNQLGPRCRGFPGSTATAMADLGIRYLTKREDDRPLLLWAHFTDPHLPYLGSYRQELTRVDNEVGRLLAHTRDNTIVIVVSDHGESFGAHGFRGHIWRLDEELLRVLLIASGPGISPTSISWPATLLDVAPTLTELLGLPTPHGWQGASLLRDPGDRAIVFESEYKGRVDLRGIRVGRHKITYDRRQGSYELYDVVEDPDDRSNLVSSEPLLFDRLRAELGRVFDRLYNDRRLLRKLQLLDSRPVVMPKHLGPLQAGSAN